MSLINREALIADAKERCKNCSYLGEGCNRDCYDIEDILDLVEDQQEVELLRWIPVTERLPDLIPCNAGTAYSEAVLVWTSGRKIMVAIWDGVDFCCDARYWEAEGEEITHWMDTVPLLALLPEPPKEGFH